MQTKSIDMNATHFALDIATLVCSHVSLEIAGSGEAMTAHCARESIGISMQQHMLIVLKATCESLAANFTNDTLCVHFDVILEVVLGLEGCATNCAVEIAFTRVHLTHVISHAEWLHKFTAQLARNHFRMCDFYVRIHFEFVGEFGAAETAQKPTAIVVDVFGTDVMNEIGFRL